MVLTVLEVFKYIGPLWPLSTGSIQLLAYSTNHKQVVTKQLKLLS